jgi:pimeloyl-ACP methyl ester carboxylesterase
MAGIRPETLIRMLARPASALLPGLASRILARMFITPMQRPARAEEADVLAAASEHSIPGPEGRAIPVYSWGAGPTVLLAHGWSSSTAQLTPFVEPLLERGFRVVGFDQLGHGHAAGGTAALPQFADVMLCVAEAEGPIHGVIAHSMGAAATTMTLARGMQAERLVYVAPPENLVSYLIRLAVHLGFSPKVAQRAEEMLERRYDGRFEDIRGQVLGPTLQCDLLVVHDRIDLEVPLSEGQRIVDTWGGPAQLHLTEGLGHNRLLAALEVQQAASSFLSAAMPANPG